MGTEESELCRRQAAKDDGWDDQLDRDAAAGEIDWLVAEADDEAARGLLREWPRPT